MNKTNIILMNLVFQWLNLKDMETTITCIVYTSEQILQRLQGCMKAGPGQLYSNLEPALLRFP